MMDLLLRLIGWAHRGRESHGDRAYHRAMAVSGDVLRRMREVPGAGEPARSVIVDILTHRHNVPFMTTLVEATAEMKAPLRQSSADR